eukprot:Amastigsp_a511397_7.p3 type:complete len:103 gc:universal Amastigsp_a511397_7:707-399(-)
MTARALAPSRSTSAARKSRAAQRLPSENKAMRRGFASGSLTTRARSASTAPASRSRDMSESELRAKFPIAPAAFARVFASGSSSSAISGSIELASAGYVAAE